MSASIYAGSWDPFKLQKVKHAQRQQKTLEPIAKSLGFALRVLNEGQCLEFRRADGLLFEWFPSTGRYMVNKKSERHEKLCNVGEMLDFLRGLKGGGK